MLYIFNVISGSMIVLDMDLALQKVDKLKGAIQRETNTPVEKQVLLISGGVALEDHQDVGHYTAGTDTNPIYFFSMTAIDNDNLPYVPIDYPQDSEVKDKIEESKHLSACYSTVFSRAQLAQKVFEYSQDIMNHCEKVIHYQHLQQQGWAAAVANLEDILVALKKQFNTFEKAFKEQMLIREHRLNLIDNFKEDLELLQKIPLLPALSSSSSCNIGVMSDNLLLVNDVSSSLHNERLQSSTIKKKSLTLLDWILPKGFCDIEGPLVDYKSRLTKLDHSLREELCAKYNLICVDNRGEYKSIGGLEDRLFMLQELLRDAKKYVTDQKTFADSFFHNQQRCASVRDDSIYPNLCKSQVSQLDKMLHQHEKIKDIHRRCIKARDELSFHITTRLKWIYSLEQKVNSLDSRLLLWIDNMKKMDSQLSIYEQVHTCPKLYFDAVAEVIRRQNFCQNFSGWAFQLSTESKSIWDKEVTIRETFMELISSHFLKDLFPGLNDIPPAFATECPETFDQRLPKLTSDNILLLRELVPEICSQISFSELEGIPPILRHTDSLNNKENENISSEARFKYSNELFASAVDSTTVHKTTSTEPKSDPPVSPDHYIVSRPTSLIRDHPESETDTEEFEKVCGSISDGTYSPMEPERNIPLSKMKSRSSQETNPSPLSDRLQSPPSQLLHEFVTVQCRIPEEGEPTSHLIFEDLTHTDLINAFQSEAHLLKYFQKENLSQDDLKAIVSKLAPIISKLNDVKMESLSTSTLKKTHDQIELKNNLLNDAHHEIEIYQNEIKMLQTNIQQIGIEFDEERRHLKSEHEDIIRQLSLEHELEIETIQLMVEERSDELESQKNKLSEVELVLRNSEIERHSLSTKIDEMESVYREREKEAIVKEQRKLLEENIRDKQSSLTELRVQLEREFTEKMEKEKQEMEDEYKKELLKCSQLWEAQSELLVIQKSKEQKDELVTKHESELENAKLQHKMEIESLRSRFRMMTMDRSPSETSLEKVERGDFIEASVHELALMKIREELNKEKEVALDELRICLEESYKATLKNEMQKLEENRKKINAEKQEEFNSVVKSVTLDKERVIENLRLRIEFLTDENEKHLKHSSPLKLSYEDQGQQQHSCEAHKKEIDRLEKELHRLRRLSFITERHTDVSLTFSETGPAQVTSSSTLEQPSASAACLNEEIKKLQQENSELNQAFIRYRGERPPKISMFSCQPYDFVLIIWDDLYIHYRVLLEGQYSLHFLHSESYEFLGLSRERPNKMFCFAEVVRKEFCLAKKDENRFGVPRGTKFYRVICRPSRALSSLAEVERVAYCQRKASVLGSPPGVNALSTLSLPSISSEVEFSNPSCEGAVGFSTPSCEGAVGFSTPSCEGAVGFSTPSCEGAVGFSSPSEFLYLKEIPSDQKPDSSSRTPERRHRDSRR